MKVKICTLLVISLVFASFVSADEIEVTPGTDQISAAMLGAYPGDVLVLLAGDFFETGTVVTIAGGVTIKGADGAEAIWHTPYGVDAAIEVMGDFRVENVIFLAGNDTARTVDCIRNQFGAVTAGEEPAAVKNSIFVDNCMFLRFVECGINIHDENDPIFHPVDTLYVTNSLFYGGHIGSVKGIQVRYGQAREVKVQNCTIWKIGNDAIKVYGHETQLDYLHILVDHNTVYDGTSAANPLGDEATGTLCYYMDSDDAITNNIYYMISDFGFKAKKGNFLETTYDYNLADSIGWGCGACAPWYYLVSDGGALGVNNIIADPMFNDPNAGDFSLKTGSPGIGSASDASDRGNPIVDWTRAVELAGAPITGVEQSGPQLVRSFALDQNYPNPFNPSTSISFSLAKTGHVTLDIYNITGQKVRTLVDEEKAVGFYSVNWNGLDNQNQAVAAGVYFFQLQSAAKMETRKMIIIK